MGILDVTQPTTQLLTDLAYFTLNALLGAEVADAVSLKNWWDRQFCKSQGPRLYPTIIVVEGTAIGAFRIRFR